MKKSLLMFLASFATLLLHAQTVERTVLVEEFTNASCPPCAAQNPGFHVLLNNNIDKVAIIKYQTNWPGYDPMNEQTQDQVGPRVSYYGVTGVPNVQVDGANKGTAGSVTQAHINTAYAVQAPLAINLTHSLSADLKQITINCDVTNPNTTTEWNVANAYLRLGVIEKDIVFDAAPGTNGETDFIYVMRRMYPDVTGTLVEPIAAGATVNYTWTVDVPSYTYDYNQLGVVAFIQGQTSKTVYQAAISEPQPITIDLPDAGFSTATQGPADICDYSLTPSAIVSNEGEIDITSVDVSYSLNGGTPVTQTWTGTLTPGSSETITFPTATLTPGSTVIEYTIDNLNGTYPDTYNHNNIVSAEVFSVLPADPVGHELLNGMETSVIEGIPAYTIVEKTDIVDLMVVNEAWFDDNLSTTLVVVNNAVGGFAASDKSIFAGLWWTPPGTSTTMTFHKVEMTNNLNDSLTFDVAYCQYTSENDQLLVDISTDCGVTWDNVYDKAGADLNTQPASQSFFVPADNEWRKESIDLSGYDGAEEVLVRFTVNADFGNNLFLDNINIYGTFVSGVEDAIVESNINVFPNPASSVVNIGFTMAKSNEVSVQVYDVTGKLVSTLLENQVLGAGEQRVTWNNPGATGLYFVKILTEEGEITRKVSVVK